MSSRWTFWSDERTIEDARGVLESLGGDCAPARHGEVIALDTFDARLHRRGMRLRWSARPNGRLVLFDGSPAASVEIAQLPRFGHELPAGPFRERVSAAIGRRALLPQLTVRSRFADATVRDARGKTVLRALLADRAVVDGVEERVPRSMIEIESVTGHPKHAERALVAFDAAGFARIDDDLASAFASLGRALGLRAPDRGPLDLSDHPTAAVGFRRVLARAAAEITDNCPGTAEQIDVEFLHDLRIACRRSKALLRSAKGVLLDDDRRQGAELISELARSTGPARDLDVQLIAWERRGDGTGGELAPVHQILADRAVRAHQQLSDLLTAPATSARLAAWSRLLDEPVRPGEGHEALGEVLQRRILRSHRRLVSRGRSIDDASPAQELHDLRKHAKETRYLLDAFRSVLDDRSCKRYLSQLKDLQDVLGEHQDADVHHAQLLGIFDELRAARARPATLVAIRHELLALEQRRRDARARFAATFASFDRARTRTAINDAVATLRA